MNTKAHMTKTQLACLAFAFAACGGKQKVDSIQGVMPGSSEPQATPDFEFPKEPFRNSKPEASNLRSFNLPSIKQFSIDNKIDVFLVEQHNLPTVSMQLVFEGGGALDGSKMGKASLCMDLMTEGTKDLTTAAYNEAIADLASSIGSYANLESQGITMSTLSKNFQPTFDLFSETIVNPGFRNDDLKRIQKSAQNRLDQTKKNAAGIAYRVVDRILYGKRHPFGAISTSASIKKINVSDCKKLHSKTVRPNKAKLFVVGDTTEAGVKEDFAPLLEKWKGNALVASKPKKPTTEKGKLFFVDVPGAAQSQILVVHFGPDRKDKDYLAHLLMTGALGNSFSSRINMNLREDKGYSYGARGRISYNRHFGEFVAGSQVRSDSTRQSLIEIFTEIRDLKSQKKPVTHAELSREKNGEILGLPGGFATSKATLGQYRTLDYYGLPMDYYNSYIDQVKTVGLEQVNNSAKTILDPDNAFILVVGDKDSKQLARQGKKDEPLLDNGGKPITLLDSLKSLLSDPLIGKGKFVELDADGNIK